MTSIKKFTTTFMLGLTLTLTAAAFAQKAPSDPDKTESCCAVPACCGKGDSCPMKAEHKERAKNHKGKDGCCCNGDSCDMKMKDMKEKQDKPTGN
jgi:hypothetical protein